MLFLFNHTQKNPEFQNSNNKKCSPANNPLLVLTMGFTPSPRQASLK